MAVNYAPRSLRFDELTEERLKAWHLLTNEPVAETIRRFVVEGLDRESDPDAIQARINDYARRAADFATSPQSPAPGDDRIGGDANGGGE